MRRLWLLLAGAIALAAFDGVWLTDRGSEVAAATQLSVSPSSGPPGSRVTLSASGFPRFARARVYWDGDATGMPSAFVQSNGSFTVTVTVPTRPTGSAEIRVEASGQVATASFSITEGQPSPTPSPSPTPTPSPVPSQSPAPGAPVMQSPPPDSVLTGQRVTFQWSAGSNVREYGLQVGSTPGSTQYYSRSTGRNRSATVSALPTNGSTVYVRLRWRVGSNWQSRDYI